MKEIKKNTTSLLEYKNFLFIPVTSVDNDSAEDFGFLVNSKLSKDVLQKVLNNKIEFNYLNETVVVYFPKQIGNTLNFLSLNNLNIYNKLSKSELKRYKLDYLNSNIDSFKLQNIDIPKKTKDFTNLTNAEYKYLKMLKTFQYFFNPKYKQILDQRFPIKFDVIFVLRNIIQHVISDDKIEENVKKDFILNYCKSLCLDKFQDYNIYIEVLFDEFNLKN